MYPSASFYHTSNSCERMGVNGEALQMHTVYKNCICYCKSRENPYQYYKSRKNLYQVLQVVCCVCNGSYDKIIWKNIICCWHCYLCCALVTVQTVTNFQYSFVLWCYWIIYYYLVLNQIIASRWMDNQLAYPGHFSSPQWPGYEALEKLHKHARDDQNITLKFLQ